MTMRNILVPFNFSAHSEQALKIACEFGRQLNAKLHLVHVRDVDPDSDAARLAMEQLGAVVLPSFELDNVVHREVLHGSVPQELAKYAKKCAADLIVMGTRGRSAVVELALGSVSQRVRRMVRCPVVLVTPETQESDLAPNEADVKYKSNRTSDSPALDLIARAVSLRATDIHIDPGDDEQYIVRLRIDGKIISYCTIDNTVARHLMHQYLTLAGIDQADPFRPREGRLQLPPAMQEIEVRMTASPVAGGEAVALRLFSKENVFLPLGQLGFTAEGFSTVQRMLHGSEGLVLVTGPTGSGKTTTVYSMLETLGRQNHNIVSIEDPVEFSVVFVRQLNVDERHGVSMTSGLRTLLRMDPDIIFIGEIRDPEAAGIALRAANSGRFVFSSLHTRDVAATITALRDLNVSNHSLAGNLIGIVNQRLVRRLCLKCRKAVAVSTKCQDALAAEQIEIPMEIYEPVGCESCRSSGFYGRCGIFETIMCEGDVSQAIANGADEAEIRRLIRLQGTASLSADALAKVRDGITSFGEAISARWL